jgi:hypothetical protein
MTLLASATDEMKATSAGMTRKHRIEASWHEVGNGEQQPDGAWRGRDLQSWHLQIQNYWHYVLSDVQEFVLYSGFNCFVFTRQKIGYVT